MSLANISKLIRETSNAPSTDVVLQASIDFETSSVILEVAIKILGRIISTFVMSLDAGTLELGLRGKTTANDTLVCNISDAVTSTNFQQEMTVIGRREIADMHPFGWLHGDPDFNWVLTFLNVIGVSDPVERFSGPPNMKTATAARNRYDHEKNLRLIEKAPRAMI